MFGFLKDKLKKVVDVFKKEVEEEVKTETIEVKKPVKKVVKKKAEKKKEKKEQKKEPEKKEEKEQKVVEKKKETKEEPKEEKPAETKEEKKEPAKEEPATTEEVKEEKKEEPKEEKPAEEKKSFLKKLFGKKEEEKKEEEQPATEETVEEPKEEIGKEELKEEPKKEPEEKKGFFERITETVTKFNLSESKFDELFWNLEVTLLENNVAVEVIEKIKADLKEELTTGKVSRKGVEEVIKDTLKKSIEEVLDVETFDLLKKVKTKKPYVIAFIGVNGSGKTTNMAKVAKMFQDKGLSIVFAAADTFRAAAIQQLEEHANKLKIKMIKHDYNADPAAVAFDAIEHAKAKGIDIVMIDTAGRLHSNTNLMDELKKLIRVNNPDLKIFVGESITGNDCVEQARVYNQEVGIDAIILSKADVDEKGGAAISVSYITKKPILYIGTGQTYNDLKPFNSKLVLETLGL